MFPFPLDLWLLHVLISISLSLYIYRFVNTLSKFLLAHCEIIATNYHYSLTTLQPFGLCLYSGTIPCWNFCTLLGFWQILQPSCWLTCHIVEILNCIQLNKYRRPFPLSCQLWWTAHSTNKWFSLAKHKICP